MTKSKVVRRTLIGFLVVLSIGVIGVSVTRCFRAQRERRAASKLLAIFEDLKLNHSTEKEFREATRDFDHYLHSDSYASGVEQPLVINFWVPAENPTNARIAFSALFEDGLLKERGAGLETACCRVIVSQSLLAFRSLNLGGHEALRSKLGSDDYLQFQVSPNLSPVRFRELFNFQINCLGAFWHCSSVEAINPAAKQMLAESIAAGN